MNSFEWLMMNLFAGGDKNFPACIKKASEVAVILRSKFPGYSIKNHKWCVKVSGKKHEKFDTVSVSIAPDLMGNKGNNPSTLETALFKDENLVYVSELGYSDVCYFDDVEDVVDEIHQLFEEFN